MKVSSEISESSAAGLFSGPGEIRARCREIDWAATPLGPVATWALALRAAVRLCLDSGFPMCVHAGSAEAMIYNDAYVGTFGADRHPWALGRPTREVWADVWDAVAPTYEALLAGGPADYRENAPFVIRRDGALQETFWTYSHLPIRDDDGAVVGILVVVSETTARVRTEAALRESEAALRISAAQQEFLVRLGDALRPLTSAASIQETASRLLGEHLDVNRALYADIDGEVGEEQFTIRHQYVRSVQPFPERFPARAFGERLVNRIRRGESLVVADVVTDPQFDEMERAMWASAQLRAAVAAGLMKDGRFVAAFSVQCSGPRAWTATEVALVQETAERTWEAAERARAEAARDRLLANERRARKRAEALQALAAELARAATPEEVADAVVTRGMAATGTRFGVLSLLDSDRRTFTMVAAPGAPAALFAHGRQFPNAGDFPAAIAARTGRPCVSRTRAEYAARSPGLDSVAELLGLEAEAVVPLSVDGRVVGVLSFAFDEPREFDAEEDAYLRALADLCGPALERARLVEAERARMAAEAARADAEAARSVAEAANRAKDDVLAVVSHELRAPLAPVRAIAQALRRAELPASEMREMAAEIDRLIVYEARLIDDLLDYQRASRGLLTSEGQRCDLHDIARKALRVVGPMWRAEKMRLREDLAATDPEIWAEPMRVQQIIYNLLANAVKFSPNGADIVIRTWNPAPDSVELEVVDHGEGIAPDVMARLFEPFMQASRRQRPNSGLGLGLALSRRLAELYGGTLAATTGGPGRGSTFTLRLPTGRAVQPTSEEDAPTVEWHSSHSSTPDAIEAPGGGGAGDATTPTDRPLRILVVEDDPDAARSLRRLLSLEGHVVHLARNLAAAEQIAGTEPLDVVLADLHLGTESGLAAPRRVAEAARHQGHAVPAAIVLSGYDRDSDVAQSRAAGFVAHLAKPVDDSVLLLAVQRAADVRSHERARTTNADAPDGPSA